MHVPENKKTQDPGISITSINGIPWKQGIWGGLMVGAIGQVLKKYTFHFWQII